MLRPVQAQADTQLDQVKKNKKNKGNRHVQCSVVKEKQCGTISLRSEGPRSTVSSTASSQNQQRLSQKRSKTVSVPGDGTDFLTAIELQ